MRERTKFFSWSVLSACLGTAALVCGGYAVYLVRFGAYPAPGEGSLGHVGAVIAGLIAGFVSVPLALLAVYSLRRARGYRAPRSSFRRF